MKKPEWDMSRLDVAQLRKLPVIQRAWYWIGVQSGPGGGPVHLPEAFTCHECADEPECQSAWDFYNTNGDCLEEK